MKHRCSSKATHALEQIRDCMQSVRMRLSEVEYEQLMEELYSDVKGFLDTAEDERAKRLGLR